MKKAILAVLLIACFVSAAVAAEHPSYLAARPGVVAGPHVPVHQSVKVKETMAAQRLIFGSDYSANTVWWWTPQGTELGSITSGLSNPQALDTDSKGNLYVANTGASTVLVYAKPYNGTPTTLSASGWYPVGVAQYGNGAWVAATNIFATSGAAGSVLLYNNGSLVATIQNSTFYYYYFCSFDKAGNLFIDGRDSSGNVLVGEVPGATKGKTTLNVLTVGNSIVFPGGIQVTNGNLIAIDDQSGFAIYTYKHPVNGSLGSPVYTTSLSGVSDIVSIALSGFETVWGADAGNLDWAKFKYTAGGSAVHTISQSGAALPIGVAIYPPDKY